MHNNLRSSPSNISLSLSQIGLNKVENHYSLRNISSLTSKFNKFTSEVNKINNKHELAVIDVYSLPNHVFCKSNIITYNLITYEPLVTKGLATHQGTLTCWSGSEDTGSPGQCPHQTGGPSAQLMGRVLQTGPTQTPSSLGIPTALSGPSGLEGRMPWGKRPSWRQGICSHPQAVLPSKTSQCPWIRELSCGVPHMLMMSQSEPKTMIREFCVCGTGFLCSPCSPTEMGRSVFWQLLTIFSLPCFGFQQN